MTDPRPAKFVDNLKSLNPGEKARLRRSAGLNLVDARRALGAFFRALPPGVPEWEVEQYFLIATLYPLADGGGSGNLGSTLRRTQTAANRRGLDRRMETLLDSDLTQLPFRLRQAAHLARSSRERINWVCLLEDLLHWDSPYHTVQRRWAEAYFSPHQVTVSGKEAS